MGFLKSLLDSVKAEETPHEVIMNNCWGFLSTRSGLGVSTFIDEIAILASESMRVCVMDCDPLSNYYFSRYFGNVNPKNVPSFGKRFENAETPLNECLISVSDKYKILCFGDTPNNIIFNMETSVIVKTIEELREHFDLVLLDIPYQPVMETFLMAVSGTGKLFGMIPPTTDTIFTVSKLKNLLNVAKLDDKLTYFIVMQVPHDMSVRSAFEKKNMKIIMEVEDNPNIRKYALTNPVTVMEAPGKQIQNFRSSVERLLEMMIE